MVASLDNTWVYVNEMIQEGSWLGQKEQPCD